MTAVGELYAEWNKRFRHNPEIAVNIDRPYFIGPGFVRASSGITQIRDYATLKKDKALEALLKDVQDNLKIVTAEFHDLLVSRTGMDYFGAAVPGLARPKKPLLVKKAGAEHPQTVSEPSTRSSKLK